MSPLKTVHNWLKYERLHHYPALRGFDKPEALKRLQAYDREERERCRYWLIAWSVVGVVFLLGVLVLEYSGAIARVVAHVLLIPVFFWGWIVQFLMYRRIRRRVEAKVAAELKDGRLWTCIECGYDLRASEDRCPECGAAVRVVAPDAANPETAPPEY